MIAISEQMRVADVVRIWPQTTEILVHYKLNLGSDGAYTLEFAANKYGLNLGALLEELNDMAGTITPASPLGKLG